MKTYLLATWALLALWQAAADAEESKYEIALIREVKGKGDIQVDRAWRKDTPDRIEVTLRSAEERLGKEVFVRIYFYDKDKILLTSFKEPHEVWTETGRGFEGVGMPPVFKKNSRERVVFAVPPELKKRRPATILVVFGGEDGGTVKTRPPSVDPKVLQFPEKERLLGISPNSSSDKAPF